MSRKFPLGDYWLVISKPGKLDLQDVVFSAEKSCPFLYMFLWLLSGLIDYYP